MKYKIGDKVKIRSWSDMEREYGLNENGNIKVPNCVFINLMRKYCEKIVTIEKVYSKFYWIREDDYNWTDEMIYHRATKMMSIIERLEKLRYMIKNNTDNFLIGKRIEMLKSNNPVFDVWAINFYNNIFRKIKGETK